MPVAASHDTPDIDHASVAASTGLDAPAEGSDASTAAASIGDHVTASGSDAATGDDADLLEIEPIVDWARTARRLRRQMLVIGAIVVVAWLVVGLTRDALTVRLLAELAGAGVLLSVVAEFVVVGGAALRGMLRAGARGERLSGSDVSLLPPQVACRRSRDC